MSDDRPSRRTVESNSPQRADPLRLHAPKLPLQPPDVPFHERRPRSKCGAREVTIEPTPVASVFQSVKERESKTPVEKPVIGLIPVSEQAAVTALLTGLLVVIAQ